MRTLFRLIVFLLLSMVLVACGAEDDDPEPTEEPTAAVESEPTEEADVGIPATAPVDVEEVSTPEATAEMATPTEETMMAGGVTTPIAATPIASPMGEGSAGTVAPMGTPELVASPVATPVMSASPEATSDASPVSEEQSVAPPPPATAMEATEAPRMIELSGVVQLNGTENEAYILTNEGCVGLGEYSDLHGGRQIVVRNEVGAIISVSDLDAVSDEDGCAWEFVAAVPESDFYSVSIPLTFEQVFPNAQVNENGGEVMIELP